MILALSLALVLPKKLGPISVGDLYKTCGVIATVKVEAIDAVEGISIATAKVLKLHKGKVTGTALKFIAQRTWDEDSSYAVKGETVLLYLLTRYEGPIDYDLDQPVGRATKSLTNTGFVLYTIGHYGFGRIYVDPYKDSYVISTKFDGEKTWTLNPFVVLPDDKLVKKSGKETGNILLNDLLSYH